MVKPKTSDILFWSLAGMTMALLLVFLLVLAGAIPIESPGSATETEETASTQAEPVAEEPSPTTTTSARPSQATTQQTRTVPTPELATVVITASRGDCWILARLDSETGRLLDERVLAQGESVRLRGRRVWLSVGASGNVDVTVNGKARQLPAGTIEVVLSSTI
jgi:hypothetical protein